MVRQYEFEHGEDFRLDIECQSKELIRGASAANTRTPSFVKILCGTESASMGKSHIRFRALEVSRKVSCYVYEQVFGSFGPYCRDQTTSWPPWRTTSQEPARSQWRSPKDAMPCRPPFGRPLFIVRAL